MEGGEVEKVECGGGGMNFKWAEERAAMATGMTGMTSNDSRATDKQSLACIKRSSMELKTSAPLVLVVSKSRYGAMD